MHLCKHNVPYTFLRLLDVPPIETFHHCVTENFVLFKSRQSQATQT